MTTAVCFERRGHRVVDAYYARRIAEEKAAHGYLITGLQAEPEKRKQQRNSDMHCSSRCRQRAYRRRSSTTRGLRHGYAVVPQERLGDRP